MVAMVATFFRNLSCDSRDKIVFPIYGYHHALRTLRWSGVFHWPVKPLWYDKYCDVCYLIADASVRSGMTLSPRKKSSLVT
jgi:hypothetical protein